MTITPEITVLEPQPPLLVEPPSARPAIFGGAPLFEERLPIVRPGLPPASDVLDQFQRSIESGRLTNGEVVRRFEQAAARYLGVPECVAVSSCTSGLMLV